MSKKNLIIVAAASLAGLCISGANAADANSFYFGGTVGAGKINPGTALQITATNPSTKIESDINVAGRVFAGYQVNETFGFESGFTKFHNASTKNIANTGFNSSNDVTVKTYAVDLVGKATLPLQNGFSVYGKAGAAYLNQKGNTNTYTTLASVTTSTSTNQTASAIYPTVGAGVSYELNKNVSTDLSWNHIQKVGSNKNLGNTDLVGVSFTYAIN